MEKVIDNYCVSYDELTDTLYIAISSSIIADNFEFDDDYIYVRRTQNQVISVTIDGFMNRHHDGTWNNNLILKYLPNVKISEIKAFISTPC